MKETIVEPSLSYKVLPWLEPLAGFRYDNVKVDAVGPFGTAHSGTTDWYDPIIGANLSWSISDSVALRFRGDIGGFGVGAHFTYQAFPYVDWQVAKILSLQGGYRVLYINYEQGTKGVGGGTYIKYAVTELGLQLGLKFLLNL